MRIALAVDGTRGDVFPMLALADRLRRASHDVVICGPPDSEAECQDRGLVFRPMGANVREFLGREARAMAAGPLAFAVAGKRYFDETVALQFERLPDATADVDLILGAGLCFAGSSAAELHRIPYRFVTYCPILLPSAEHPPFIVPAATTPRFVNRLLWRFLVPPFAKFLGIPINAGRRALGLAPLKDVYSALVSERPILATAPELAPVPADCSLPVDQVGCLHATTGPPLPDKLRHFLDAGDAPVYIGFGSMTDGDPAATTRNLLAAVEAIGCRTLLGAGWAGLGEGPLPEHVHRVATVDHNQLFPRASVIVHHGGAGTTTSAARAGTPQIVVPHGVDQYYWGARVHQLGLGPPPLPRAKLTASRLEGHLRSVLDAEIVNERATALRDRIHASEADLPDPVETITRGV
jgi:vancomycin aglycone glucosyltransferase